MKYLEVALLNISFYNSLKITNANIAEIIVFYHAVISW